MSTTAPKPLRLGILVPSSNTALEPLTYALVASIPNTTVHFSRFPVTEIALSSKALAQFDDSHIVSAAKLLADAHVDIIGWSGTSAGWLGLEADRKLCARIEEVTGVRATTSVLGLFGILKRALPGKERPYGLVTPYLDAVQVRVVKTMAEEGFPVAAESHLNRQVNVKFADIDEETLDWQMAEVMKGLPREGVKVVSTFCTNLKAAHRAAHWEEQYPGLVVADTVSTVVLEMLRVVGSETPAIEGWGKIFGLLSQ